MSAFRWSVVLFLLVFTGCSSGSTVKGVLVDESNAPLYNYAVCADQDDRMLVEGYSHFETKSGTDGAFVFKGLYPNSSYDVQPCKTESRVIGKYLESVRTANKGETVRLLISA